MNDQREDSKSQKRTNETQPNDLPSTKVWVMAHTTKLNQQMVHVREDIYFKDPIATWTLAKEVMD